MPDKINSTIQVLKLCLLVAYIYLHETMYESGNLEYFIFFTLLNTENMQ